MMPDAVFDIADLSATDRLGQLLAEHLPDGSVVALNGTLGAGKTKLVQAIAKYTGIAEETVSSPTFVLLHEYHDGDRPIYHFDAYRLESVEEFRRLSPDDYFESTGLTFIEWADKFPQILPEHHLEIQIILLGETQRRIHLMGHGIKYETVIAKFKDSPDLCQNELRPTPIDSDC
jgi:tRNA threonylcarbamoyladenosine biosynthesis protein TsaE